VAPRKEEVVEIEFRAIELTRSERDALESLALQMQAARDPAAPRLLALVARWDEASAEIKEFA
jgi:hypothetical protein